MQISKRDFLHLLPTLEMYNNSAFQGTGPLQFRKLRGPQDFFGSGPPSERGPTPDHNLQCLRGCEGSWEEEGSEAAGSRISGHAGVCGEQRLKRAASQFSTNSHHVDM